MLSRFLPFRRSAPVPEEKKDARKTGYLDPQSPDSLLSTKLRQQLLEVIWRMTSLSRGHFEKLYLSPIHRYAALVQQLPASESHHHAYPGGMLDHGLEIIAYALKLKQSFLLPPGAAPEEQSAQTEAWSVGLAYGALLHDIGKIAVDQRIELASGKVWKPWHGPIAEPYRISFVKGRDYKQHPAAGALLVNQVLTSEILDWLSEFRDLFGGLAFVLSGHYDQAGLLGELVIKADQASVAKALGGNPAKAMDAPKESLQGKLVTGLRHLVKTQLRLNQPGAAGWLTQDSLWLVSKTVSDQLRALLLTQGVEGIPTRNSRLFDEMQAHGIIQATPADMAIWTCEVADDSGWKQSLTMLKVMPALIWGAEERPEPFKGTVTPALDQSAPVLDTAGADAVMEKEVAPAGAVQSRNELSPPAHLVYEGLDENIYAEDAAALYGGAPQAEDDDLADLFRQHTDANTPEYPYENDGDVASSPPLMAPPAVDLGQSSASAAPASSDGEDLGQRFVGWLREGLRSRRIVINDAKATVHTVSGTAFIVSPGIFQRFIQEHPGAVRREKGQQDTESWKEVQKRFQKLSLHRKTGNGLNIWKCSVVGQRKARHIKGFLLADPATLFESVPHDNPFLSLELEQGE